MAKNKTQDKTQEAPQEQDAKTTLLSAPYGVLNIIKTGVYATLALAGEYAGAVLHILITPDEQVASAKVKMRGKLATCHVELVDGPMRGLAVRNYAVVRENTTKHGVRLTTWVPSGFGDVVTTAQAMAAGIEGESAAGVRDELWSNPLHRAMRAATLDVLGGAAEVERIMKRREDMASRAPAATVTQDAKMAGGLAY